MVLRTFPHRSGSHDTSAGRANICDCLPDEEVDVPVPLPEFVEDPTVEDVCERV
jgi:hypothetical protein